MLKNIFTKIKQRMCKHTWEITNVEFINICKRSSEITEIKEGNK
jgi:hypothetical protein